MRETLATPARVLRYWCIGFLGGVLISWALFFDSGAPTDWLLVAEGFFVLAALVTFTAIKKIGGEGLLILLFLVGAAAGVYVYHERFPDPGSVAFIPEGSAHVEGTVVQVRSSGEGQQLTLSALTIEDAAALDRAIVFAPAFPSRAYGDRIALRCDLKKPEPFNGFRYDRFLASKSIYATCFAREAPLLIAEGKGNPVKAVLLDVRASLIDNIDQTFGEPHASLLAGLLLGEQRFSEQWNERFVATGTSHIVAASGYNVATVSFLVFLFLVTVRVKRKQAFAFVFLAIVAYVVMAGAESAVVRAGVMGLLVLTAKQLGRRASMVNVLLITAAVMLAFNPRLLRDDVGFQLSMLSTIGLIYFTPVLDARLKFVPEDFGVREALSATLAATLFTLPIIVFSFGQVSLVGPFVNLLVLPFIPFVMALGFVAVLLAYVSSALATLVGIFSWALLSVMLFVINVFSTLPFAAIVLPDGYAAVFAIASLAGVFFLWQKLTKNISEPSLASR